MLTKNDLKALEKMIEDVSERVSKRVSKETVGDFWEEIIVPYLQEEHKLNQKEHQKTRKLLEEKVADIADYIKDHEKRITRLERVVHP